MPTEPALNADAARPDSTPARGARRLTLALAATALLLVAALASLPFFAGRPRPAPAVTITTLAGDQVPLSQLRGRVVLVSFWSTTCGPCMAEMPSVIALHRALAPRGLATYAVAMSYDRPDRVLDMAQGRALPFTVAFDHDGSVARGFNNTEVTPTKFLIDARGNIVRTYVGFTDFPALRAQIEALLAS